MEYKCKFHHPLVFYSTLFKTFTVSLLSDYTSHRVLTGHSGPIGCLSWSPDSQTILTGSNDKSLRDWSVKTGHSLVTFSSAHTDAVSSCAWLPDGQRFLSSGVDKQILLWSAASAQVLHRWSGLRVTDLVVPPAGEIMITISDRRIRMYSLDTKEEVG